MKSFTTKLRFSEKTKQTILARDNYRCLFCLMQYNMPNNINQNLGLHILDIAHFVNRSQLGLGIEENGITLCRYHHHLMDNSKYRNELLAIVKKRLEILYENWDERKLKYAKYKK